MGDIDSVQKNARLKRLAMQVELTADLEGKLPKFVLHRCIKDHLVVYPNRPQEAFYQVSDGHRLLLLCSIGLVDSVQGLWTGSPWFDFQFREKFVFATPSAIEFRL